MKERSSSSLQAAPRTSYCSIEQVPGLDYTEPAFQLAVVAADDKSQVTFSFQVGTVSGGNNVLSKTEYGGPSAIISQVMMPWLQQFKKKDCKYQT